jgi:putative FmdB family regulatory protein
MSPLYEYACENGHVSERFVPLSERPDAVVCDTCQKPAEFVLSPTPTTFRANDRRAFKGKRR